MSQPAQTLTIGGRAFALGNAPHIIGVVNLSPDSPNQDSVVALHKLEARAAALVRAGAAIIDVGAQSSHFRSRLRPLDEERRVIAEAVRRLKAGGFLVSVDTFRAPVAAAAIEAGCDVVNDSEGLHTSAMLRTLAATPIPVIVPFLSGPSPRDMQPFDLRRPLGAILSGLRTALERAAAAGIRTLILDPGTGYVYRGVSAEEKERYQVLVYRSLARIRDLGYPVLVAMPRKPSKERTLELTRMIVENGADFIRAHDPALAREAIARAKVPA